MATQVIQWRAADGGLFDSEAEANVRDREIAYAKSPEGIKQAAITSFKRSFSGKRLIDQFSLDYVDVWEILGEDTNFDMGGTHIQPHLAYVRGTLAQAIEYAVVQRGWGYGGNISPHDITVIDLTVKD